MYLLTNEIKVQETLVQSSCKKTVAYVYTASKGSFFTGDFFIKIFCRDSAVIFLA